MDKVMELALLTFPQMTASPAVNRAGMYQQMKVQVYEQLIKDLRDLCDDQREQFDDLVLEAMEKINDWRL